jgi:hypothetical protein
MKNEGFVSRDLVSMSDTTNEFCWRVSEKKLCLRRRSAMIAMGDIEAIVSVLLMWTQNSGRQSGIERSCCRATD